jgi:hypothetical protein
MSSTDVLIVWGGWDGHEPEPFAEHYATVLRGEGLTVDLSPTLDALRDADALRRLRLIVPIWTMGEIADEQLQPLLAAVASGVGLAGFHGGMGDHGVPAGQRAVGARLRDAGRLDAALGRGRGLLLLARPHDRGPRGARGRGAAATRDCGRRADAAEQQAGESG